MNLNFCINTERLFFAGIFFVNPIFYVELMTKSDFVNCLEHIFSDSNITETQLCCLLDYINTS